jgi:SAM-dependent methyltransferase
MLRQLLSKETRRELVRLRQWPPVGFVRFGSLRRLRPVNENWGTERGGPIDRYYIESFLDAHRNDVRGVVLEVGTDAYTRRFGDGRVTRSEVLHVEESRPEVTIVADLTRADHVASDSFDCIILTQTLQVIYDVRAVVETVYRLLKPGGVVLVTVSGISKISRYDMDRWGHYWSFTTRSMRRLFEARFPQEAVQVAAYGNVLAATAFLHGLSPRDLRQKELEFHDPNYELVVSLRATKPGGLP